ncbi:MAG: PIN domain-containing protein [Terracidiphilus sp.]|jgi:predicted nucleic acid-binding protein
MRLAVFDTNVIVSAGLKPGSIPARLVMDWVLAGQMQLVTCPSVIAEYSEVAARSKFARYEFPPAWLELLIESSLQLPDPPPWTHSTPDVKDAPFLALAHAAGAWLVTGNLKHFPKPARAGVTVLSPAEYLAHLGERNEGLEGA